MAKCDSIAGYPVELPAAEGFLPFRPTPTLPGRGQRPGEILADAMTVRNHGRAPVAADSQRAIT